MPGTFGSAKMPFGKFFPYTVQNVEVRDNNYFLTVIYSGRNSEQDQYLRHWIRHHPGLRDLQSKTNFREMTVADPIYQSALRTAVPQTPAVLLTRPADNGPYGQTVFLAYGESLSTDPNLIVKQLQSAMQNFEQTMYQPQEVQTLQPVVPDVYVPQEQPFTSDNFLVIGVLAILAYFVFTKKRR